MDKRVEKESRNVSSLALLQRNNLVCKLKYKSIYSLHPDCLMLIVCPDVPEGQICFFLQFDLIEDRGGNRLKV